MSQPRSELCLLEGAAGVGRPGVGSSAVQGLVGAAVFHRLRPARSGPAHITLSLGINKVRKRAHQQPDSAACPAATHQATFLTALPQFLITAAAKMPHSQTRQRRSRERTHPSLSQGWGRTGGGACRAPSCTTCLPRFPRQRRCNSVIHG